MFQGFMELFNTSNSRVLKTVNLSLIILNKLPVFDIMLFGGYWIYD